jgi:hypothetical protein
MTDELYPVFYFLALITSHGMVVLTAIFTVLVSIVIVLSKLVKMIR